MKTRWDRFERDLQRVLPTTEEAIKKELKELVALIEYRPGVMSEALAQRKNIEVYWKGLLSFNAVSHPWTCDLVEIVMRVGQFQAMHYKRLFNRARPSQLCPALMPPIEPPGHASFPSGHATEGYLLSLCLRKVLPEVLRTPADPANPTNQTDPEDEGGRAAHYFNRPFSRQPPLDHATMSIQAENRDHDRRDQDDQTEDAQ